MLKATSEPHEIESHESELPDSRFRIADAASRRPTPILLSYAHASAEIRSFEKGLADRRGYREEILPMPHFFLCPLRRRGTYFWRTFFGCFWGSVCRQPPPANPFSKHLKKGTDDIAILFASSSTCAPPRIVPAPLPMRPRIRGFCYRRLQTRFLWKFLLHLHPIRLGRRLTKKPFDHLVFSCLVTFSDSLLASCHPKRRRRYTPPVALQGAAAPVSQLFPQFRAHRRGVTATPH